MASLEVLDIVEMGLVHGLDILVQLLDSDLIRIFASLEPTLYLE